MIFLDIVWCELLAAALALPLSGKSFLSIYNNCLEIRQKQKVKLKRHLFFFPNSEFRITLTSPFLLITKSAKEPK